MNNYAKAIMWIGLFLIIAQLVKNWHVLSATLFAQNSSGLKVPGPGGIPPNPATGKCPGPNYFFFQGRCYPASVNLPPAPSKSPVI